MKRPKIVAITIICLVSVIINIVAIVNYNNAKRFFIFRIYSHLVNIEKILEGMSSYRASNEGLDEYLTNALEEECIELNVTVISLNAIQSNNQGVYGFREFNYKMVNDLYTVNDIEAARENIKLLIMELSLNKQLEYGEYGNILKNPDYSLSISRIIDLINGFSVKYQQRHVEEVLRYFAKHLQCPMT